MSNSSEHILQPNNDRPAGGGTNTPVGRSAGIRKKRSPNKPKAKYSEENMVSSEFCYEQMILLRGEIDILKWQNEGLKQGLHRAIKSLENEIDDLEFINELNKILNL